MHSLPSHIKPTVSGVELDSEEELEDASFPSSRQHGSAKCIMGHRLPADTGTWHSGVGHGDMRRARVEEGGKEAGRQVASEGV